MSEEISKEVTTYGKDTPVGRPDIDGRAAQGQCDRTAG
jgi:hypothetical protein